MSKFNKKKPNALKKQETVNIAGGIAYSIDAKKQFVMFILTKFFAQQYYSSEKEQLEELVNLVGLVDPLFIAKACIYARTEIGMKSVTHAFSGELAQKCSHLPWLSRFFDKIIKRPDDMMEIAGYFWGKTAPKLNLEKINQFETRNTLPNFLKRGFKKTFNRFNDFNLSKYAQTTREIKLVDIVNLVHPKPTLKNQDALKELIQTGTIKNKTTSQRVLTTIGQSGLSAEEKIQKRQEYWMKSIAQHKIGYLDLLRSLTKILADVDDILTIKCAAGQLTQKEAMDKSLTMPFQYFFAIKEICKINNYSLSNKCQIFLKALSYCLDYSITNLSEFPGKTLICIDHSGSMQSSFNGKETNMVEIANLMAALLAKKFSNKVNIMTFHHEATLRSEINPKDSVVGMMNILNANVNGGSTNFGSIFDFLFKCVGMMNCEIAMRQPLICPTNRSDIEFDRIIFISDMQSYGNSFYEIYKTYCRIIGKTPYLYMFDLTGHGTLSVPQSKCFHIGGFSEKVFEFMSGLELGEDALINKIENIKI